jgi:hypothetical protein
MEFRRIAALILGGSALPLLWLSAADLTLSHDDQKQVIEHVAQQLHDNYVFPEMGAKMADGLQQKLRQGGYDQATDATAFAQSVTGDMQDISHDRHLRLGYRGATSGGANQMPANPGSPKPIDAPEKLPGNIGYIRVHGFPPPEVFGAPFESAMKELAGADAIIIDLRDNGGGSPQSVMLAAGYFIPKRTLVAKIYSRPNDSTTEMWTTEVPRPHFQKGLYILTNGRTFSAAEAMAYHMKALGRAVIVGEASGGGAHRVNPADVGKGFILMVAVTKPTNVVTGGDWEGTGVIPDLAVPADSAVQAAQVAALKKLPASAERTALIKKLER